MLKRIFKLFEEIMVAAAFAEEGVDILERERPANRAPMMHLKVRETL